MEADGKVEADGGGWRRAGGAAHSALLSRLTHSLYFLRLLNVTVPF